MRDFSRSIRVDAPPERVWAVMRDVARWPEWTPTVTRVTPLRPGPLMLGTRVAIRQPKLPPALWQIVELEEGRGFTWVTRSPGVTVRARHGVEPDGTGTRATLSLRFEGLFGGFVGRITRDLNLRYLDLEANGLKARSEGSGSD